MANNTATVNEMKKKPGAHFRPPVSRGEKADPPKMSLAKELIGIFCLLLALLIFCHFAGNVLTTKRLDYGATWGMYLKEPENTVDVLFYGSSLAYCDIAPPVMYDETGVAAYVMAGPEQSFSITYRYLMESCKTQSPQVVFVEATRMAESANNRSLKVNLTYMPWGENRLIPTFEEAGENERPGLLFPLYAYHDRWDNLTADDWRLGIFGYEADPMAGYTWLGRIAPVEEITQQEPDADEESYAASLEYAGKMQEFCKSKNIRLVFFLSPAAERLDAALVQRMESDLTALGAEFVDFNACFEEIGFDLAEDFGDALHTNYKGAEKFSRYLANRLGEWGVSPAGQADNTLWQGRVEHFISLRDEAGQKAAEGAKADTAGEEGGGES